MRIVHLSDMHLYGDDTLQYGLVDTAAALRRVLRAAEAVSAVDVVVCSGDLSDDGTEASYRRLRDLVDPWAASRGAEVVYVMGNHDVAAGFEPVLGERTGVTSIGGVRFVRLDSAVPGRGFGRIDAAQLAWLRDELAASTAPTLVVLHHPPTRAGSALLAGLELQDRDELLETCSDGSVVAILAGHYHHALVTSERGIPVVVAPGIANTSDPHAPAGRERALVGSGYAVIDLAVAGSSGRAASDTAPAPRVTVHAVPSPEDGRVIFDLDPAEVAAILQKAGPA